MDTSIIQLNPDETGYVCANKKLSELRFRKALSFHYPEGLAAVEDETGAYHIDTSGVPVYAQRYKQAFGFYQQRASVCDERGFFHIQPSGEPAYAARYDWTGNFQEGLCTVRSVGGGFHISSDGTPAYPQRYSYVGDFKYGIAVAHQYGKAFHILRDGSRLNRAEYLDANPYHKGTAVVCDKSGCYHVNKDGKELYSHRFQQAEPFYNGVARCQKKTGTFVALRENGFYTYMCDPKPVLQITELRKFLNEGARAVLYIRHAERPQIARGEWGGDILLSEQGKSDAIAYGEALEFIPETVFYSSDVLRCRQTATLIAKGMGLSLSAHDIFFDKPLLGSPGPFTNIADPAIFEPVNFSQVMYTYVQYGEHPGLFPLTMAGEKLIESIRAKTCMAPLTVMVTHDFFVAGIEHFLGLRLPKQGTWVDFLEGVCWLEHSTGKGEWHIIRVT